MDQRTFNEIKSAIKYMEFKPVLLSKFYDVKSLLLTEINDNEDYYKVSSIMPDPSNDNKIVKCVNILNDKFMKNKEVVDCTKAPGYIPEKAIDFLNKITLRESASYVSLVIGSDIKANVYISIPRANSITLDNVTLGNDTEFKLMNVFNTYVTEGFTISFTFDGISVSIEPSALEGIKGQGDLFVYVMDDKAIYKDFASKYFNAEAVLKVYHG